MPQQKPRSWSDVPVVQAPASDPVKAADGALDAAPAASPCPHCGGPTIPHDAPPGAPKHAARHCDACGGCWVHRGDAWVTREGHPPPTGWAGG